MRDNKWICAMLCFVRGCPHAVIRISNFFFPQNGEFDNNAITALPDVFSLVVKLAQRTDCSYKLILFRKTLTSNYDLPNT